MNTRRLKKKFAKIAWYRQAAAVKPFYAGYPWRSCSHFTLYQADAPIRYQGYVVYLGNDYFDVYFDRENLDTVARFYFRRQQRTPEFIARLRRHWERHCVAPWRNLLHRLSATDFSRHTNAQLLGAFGGFSRAYQILWREAIFLDAFDVSSDEILRRAIQREGKRIRESDVHALTAQTAYSWLQQERHDLLELGEAVKKSSSLRRAIVRGMARSRLRARYPVFYRRLEAHAAAYHWIYNDYAVIQNLPPRFFQRRLRELVRHPENFRTEKKNLRWTARAASRKRKLARKLRLSPGFMRTVNFLVDLAAWRDDRKSYQQMAGGVLRRFAVEFQRRSGLPERTVEYLFWWEVQSIFSIGKRLRKLTADRYRGVLYLGDPAQPQSAVTGNSGRELHRYLHYLTTQGKALHGKTAFAGVARGRVKIIRTQNDFGKMKKGDILVAPNTRPEYVPIMKLAGAIITEEGGLTCHAAIVSRELKIPCIVGMQGVLGTLKDGDYVDVDAKKGIVGILK